MNKIYPHQTALTLTFETGVKLEHVDTVELKALDPLGVESTFDLIIIDAELGIVQHDVKKIEEVLGPPKIPAHYEFEEEGYWIFWVYVLYENGEEAYSAPVRQRVWKEGT